MSSGIIVSWFSLLCYIEDIDFWKKEISSITILWGIVGFVGVMVSMLIDYHEFGIYTITATIIFSSVQTITTILKKINKNNE